MTLGDDDEVIQDTKPLQACICGSVDLPGSSHTHGPITGLDFGRALWWLKRGQKVRRLSMGLGMEIKLARASELVRPHLVATYGDGSAMLGYSPGIQDLLSEDWEVST